MRGESQNKGVPDETEIINKLRPLFLATWDRPPQFTNTKAKYPNSIVHR